MASRSAKVNEFSNLSCARRRCHSLVRAESIVSFSHTLAMAKPFRFIELVQLIWRWPVRGRESERTFSCNCQLAWIARALRTDTHSSLEIEWLIGEETQVSAGKRNLLEPKIGLSESDI